MIRLNLILNSSRYGKPNQETNSPAWPILQNRYQLLSLLGKGGFSEVYKVFEYFIEIKY